MTLSPLEVFNLLTPREKQQVIATLQLEQFKPQQSPCEKLGHKYKAVRTENYLFGLINKTQFVCTQCGSTKWI